MKPAVKYALMGVGGIVLLAGSFVTFAALSGAPLHEVAILKNFVKAPDKPESPEKGSKKGHADEGGDEHATETHATEKTATAKHASDDPHATKPAPTRAESRALEANVGVLGAFMLPSPFSSNELSELQTSLRGANEDAKQRLERIELRERELGEWEHALEQRNDELQDLRRLLEKRELELTMREDEVKRDEKAKDARDQQSWAELAKFFSEGDPDDLAKKLVLFEPKEAVRILRSLDDERASALVNALPADKYHAYLQAYRDAVTKN
ncbi:MAG: hypothetical protein IPJ77_23180 [Planctomycetes bacterium]|nr:hypothetical protein [Planctomycetota bacterium]